MVSASVRRNLNLTKRWRNCQFEMSLISILYEFDSMKTADLERVSKYLQKIKQIFVMAIFPALLLTIWHSLFRFRDKFGINMFTFENIIHWNRLRFKNIEVMWLNVYFISYLSSMIQVSHNTLFVFSIFSWYGPSVKLHQGYNKTLLLCPSVG